MYRNYTLSHRVIACVLLLSLFLQSCGNSFNSSMRIEEKHDTPDKQALTNEQPDKKSGAISKSPQAYQTTIYQEREKETKEKVAENLLVYNRNENVEAQYPSEEEEKIDWLANPMSPSYLLGLPVLCAARYSTLLKKRAVMSSSCLVGRSRSNLLGACNQPIVSGRHLSSTSKTSPIFKYNRSEFHVVQRINLARSQKESREQETVQSVFGLPRGVYVGLGVGGIDLVVKEEFEEKGTEEKKKVEKDPIYEKETDKQFNYSSTIRHRLYSPLEQTQQTSAIGQDGYKNYDEAIKGLPNNDPKKKCIDLTKGKALTELDLLGLKKAMENNFVVEEIQWGGVPQDPNCEALRKQIEDKLKQNRRYRELLEDLRTNNPKKKCIDLRGTTLTKEQLEELRKALRDNRVVGYIEWGENLKGIQEEIQKLDIKLQELRKLEMELDKKNSQESKEQQELKVHLQKLKNKQKEELQGLIQEPEKKELQELIQEIKKKLQTLKSLKEETENKLVQNICDYTYHPSDYVHGLLAMHIYEHPKKGEQDFNDINKNKDGKELKLPLPSNMNRDWKVVQFEDDSARSGFYSALYVNDSTHQAVLCFQGTDPKRIGELLRTQSDLQQDIDGVLGNKITRQEELAYQATEAAVKYAQQQGLNLSITGHSLGGYLAELGVAFCHWRFNCRQVRGIVFDSPGAEKKLRRLFVSKFNRQHFPLTTYFFELNLINSCHLHLGEMHRVNLTPNINIGFKNIIDRTLETHQLAPILEKFELSTGKPKASERMEEWPKHNTNHTSYVGKEAAIARLIGGTLGAVIGAKMGFYVKDRLSSLFRARLNSLLVNRLNGFPKGRYGLFMKNRFLQKPNRISLIISVTLGCIMGASIGDKIGSSITAYCLGNLGTLGSIGAVLFDLLTIDISQFLAAITAGDNEAFKREFKGSCKIDPRLSHQHDLNIGEYKGVDSYLKKLHKYKEVCQEDTLQQLLEESIAGKVLSKILDEKYEIVPNFGQANIKLKSEEKYIENLRDKMQRAIDVLTSDRIDDVFQHILPYKLILISQNVESLQTSDTEANTALGKISRDLSKQSQNTGAVIEQLSFKQGTAKLYKFNKPTSEEIHKIEEDKKALDRQLLQVEKLRKCLEAFKEDLEQEIKQLEDVMSSRNTKEDLEEINNKLDSLIKTLEEEKFKLSALDKQVLSDIKNKIKACLNNAKGADNIKTDRKEFLEELWKYLKEKIKRLQQLQSEIGPQIDDIVNGLEHEKQQLKIAKKGTDALLMYMQEKLPEADGQLDSLIGTLKKKETKLPGLNKDVLLNKAYSLKAKIAARSEEYGTSKTHYSDAIKWLPGDPLTLSNYGGLLSDYGRSEKKEKEKKAELYIEAYRCYEEVFRYLNKVQPDQLYIVCSSAAYAFILLAKSIKKKQVDRIQAELPSTKELHRQAKILLERAIQAKPDYLNAYLHSAMLSYDQGHYKTALREIENALKINPKHPTTLMYKGFIKHKLGQHDEALRLLNEALEIYKKNSKGNNSWIKEVEHKIIQINKSDIWKFFKNKLAFL